MKNYFFAFLIIALFFIVYSGCSDPASAINSLGLDEIAEETGTVSGTAEDADITLHQSDGTMQTTSTGNGDSGFIFENVPTGETTIEFTTASGTTEQTIQVNNEEETLVNPFGSTQEMDNSLTAQIYEVPYQNRSVNNILEENTLGDEFFAKEINVPTRSFEEGFPGLTDRFEWFGIIYNGTITAPATGEYIFKLRCDDGAVLYIDGEVVVNGDGCHAPRNYTGSIDLVEGEEYSITIKYFQGPRYHIALVVSAQIPGEEMELFNMDNF